MHTGIAMGVTVEEVNPAELYDVLVGASSQDPQILHQSDKRLKIMLEHFGAFDALQTIAAERSVPLPVRKLAIIQFKNEALKSWKSRKLQNDEHRKRIRARCLTFLEEEDQTIADCNRVIVSKIARQDFPLAWPNLVNDLMAIIDSNLQQRYSSSSSDPRNTVLLQRGLELLNGVLREFAAQKLLTGAKTMAALVEQLHGVLYGYYATMAAAFTTVDAASIHSDRVYYDVLLAHQVYKCVSKIAIWLWQRGENTGAEAFKSKQEWFNQFFQSSATQVKALLQLRHGIMTSLTQETRQSRAFIEVLTKHVRHLGKCFRRLAQLSHVRFVELPGCDDLVLFYWNHVSEAISAPSEAVADSPFVLYPVRILVQGMVLFKENLSQWAPVKKNGMPNQNALPQEFVANAVKTIVSRLIPLNVQDLQAWSADPEEWVNTEDKENDQWEYEIRACSERVLIQMSNQFTEYVVPLLQTMFNDLAGKPAPDFAGVLQKEALYCAMGRCAHQLQDVIPFERWASEILVAEAQSTDTNYPIIKRRIAWLIGKWVQVATNPNVPVAWQILMHLLGDRSPGTDTVVRLTAAMALRECVDTITFDINMFQQWLPMAVTELVKLMGEADTLENKRRVGSTLNTIIEYAGERISPLIDTITQPLPGIWTDAGDDFLLKASLLTTVMNLVNAVKGDSTKLTHIVIPLIREGLQEKVQLDEDALALWKVALRNCPDNAAVQPYLELFPDSLRMLGTNLDLLSQVIDLIDSYIILAGPQILQVCAVPLFEAFREALGSVSVTTQQKDMVIALNMIVTTTPSNLWGEALHVSGLFAYLLQTLFDSEVATYVLTEHIYVLSRIAMVDRSMFLQLMTHTAPKLNLSEAKLYELLMDAWWTKFDNMSESRHRKLCAMGMGSLVATGKAEILQRLHSEIFNIWTDVFAEIREITTPVEDESQDSPLRRHWEQEDPPNEIFKDSHSTPEYERRKMLYDNDPVRTLKLSTYVRDRLQEAEAMYGSEVFRTRFLAPADPTVLQQIEKELASA